MTSRAIANVIQSPSSLTPLPHLNPCQALYRFDQGMIPLVT